MGGERKRVGAGRDMWQSRRRCQRQRMSYEMVCFAKIIGADRVGTGARSARIGHGFCKYLREPCIGGRSGVFGGNLYKKKQARGNVSNYENRATIGLCRGMLSTSNGARSIVGHRFSNSMECVATFLSRQSARRDTSSLVSTADSNWKSQPRRRLGVQCNSILGVGAPEAVLVGVVALLVFGPKGLADVVKGFGQALRSFQPALRELQDVSNELQDTLKDQMGLDELEEIGRTAQQISRGQIPDTLISPSTPKYDGDERVGSTNQFESSQEENGVQSRPEESSVSMGTSDYGTGESESVPTIETEEELKLMREKSAALAWGLSSNESISEISTPSDDTKSASQSTCEKEEDF